MRARKTFIIIFVVAMAGIATADSWTLSGNYVQINLARPSGNTDNVGVGLSYDWWLNPKQTFAVEFFGSWDNPAEIYGAGFNTKFHLGPWGAFDVYYGPYADFVCASSLPSKAQGAVGESKDGWMWGPQVGFRVPWTESVEVFGEYRYSNIDGGNLREIFDEANWFIFGVEMRF